jgi:putative ABC transport system permease protein
MNLAQLLQTCFRSIFRNRMRSFLTSLGVIIGVGSVIIMVALGEGSQRAIEAQIAAMGTNLLQVMPSMQARGRGGPGIMMRMNTLTKADLQKLKDESSYAAAVAGTVQRNATVVGSQGSADVQVTGVEPEQLIITNRRVDAGTFISEDDLSSRSRVAVLGRTTAASLFGIAEDALDQQVRIGTDYYTVIGLLESKGAGMGGQDQDSVVMIPLDTAMYRLANSTAINTIQISAVSKEYMEAAQKEAEAILRESRKIADGATADFSIMNQTDMIDMATSTSKTLTTLLAAIAGVSLLVGGIGIMNIMLVSVTERTREIGIRMAVGGRKRDILFQFLTESVILSLLGGLIGIAMAFGTCEVLGMINVPTAINPSIVAGAALFAALVGIIFGYSPAQKAARLYPIDALRYE